MEDPTPLTRLTIQDIQLELIRRQQFNRFDGQRITQDLLAQRTLWEAVLLDRPCNFDLIKLRDLSSNHWNTDMLFILAVNESSAYQLKELGQQWLADSIDILDADATSRELGIIPSDARSLVEMWWD